MSVPRVALVSGASRGIGRALAVELAGRGIKVYGTGRSWPDDKSSLPFTPLDVDVTDDDSVEAGVGQVIEQSGRIDLLVNNAGVSHSGAIEETDLSVARAMFETNYLGVCRLIRAALPRMREQKAGTIAVVGSAAGKIGVPFQAHYAASKFAIEGLCESLYHELRPFGIRVLLIEPGDVRTGIWERSKSPVPKSSPYADAIDRFLKVKDREMGPAAAPAEDVAREIADVIESGTKRLRHPAPAGARLILFARKLLPDWLFFYAVARNYGQK